MLYAVFRPFVRDLSKNASLFSQIFKLIVSTIEKILDNIDKKTAHLRLSSVAQKRRLRKLPIILPSLTESATFLQARHDREGMSKPKNFNAFATGCRLTQECVNCQEKNVALLLSACQRNRYGRRAPYF